MPNFFSKWNLINRYEAIILVCISSVLLGIWLTQNTIALRNILLWLGAFVSIKCILTCYQQSIEKPKWKLSWVDFVPLILIFSMFVWVVVHYFFLSRDFEKQLHELTSTWVRAFLGLLIGASTGLVISRSPHRSLQIFLPILWLGLCISFVVLFFEYIPKAFAKKSLFAPDWYGGYIYWAKFNGVLAGSILFAGLIGLALDRYILGDHQIEKNKDFLHLSNQISPENSKLARLISIYVCIASLLVLYSFVFIFDAKAGVGMALIFTFFWFGVGLLLFFGHLIRSNKTTVRSIFYLKFIIGLSICVAVISFFAVKHTQNNPGWETLLSDIAISSKIDEYPNWQDPSQFGYPKRLDGTVIQGNTYERVAMAVVGLRIITLEPMGYGVFRSFKEQIKTYYPQYNSHLYTHSAWIDFGLAFGVPGMLIIPCTLILIFFRALFFESAFKATTLSLVLTIMVLYTVGEYAFQQSVEFLFFLTAFVATLQWKRFDIPSHKVLFTNTVSSPMGNLK